MAGTEDQLFDDDYWATREAGGVRAWLNEVTALPWAEPFTLAEAAERCGWRRPSGKYAERSPRSWWPNVQADDPAQVTRLEIDLYFWYPADHREDAPPMWLRQDVYRRIRDAVAAHLGGPPDTELVALPSWEGSYWHREGHLISVTWDRNGASLGCWRRGPGKRMRPNTPTPPPAGWDELADRLVAWLPELLRRVPFNLTDGERGAYFQHWNEREQLSEAWGDGRILARETYAKDSEPARRAAVTAILGALEAAGVELERLRYRYVVPDTPALAIGVPALGLQWEPAPESLWLTRGTGEPLPYELAAPGASTSYVLFSAERGYSEPTAVGGWRELRITGPGQELVEVDELTARRVALVLGVAQL
ncbi:hypothetical protein ACQP00_38315 [Dactylosporangium sp. CS-047395]|uniref:hypothetical protein n=1 Tax=Dactylosporangium sp. CS-047395 TaxID=3239936 RepID=UPI003D8DBD71